MVHIELSNGVSIETLPAGQQQALRNAHAAFRRLVKHENVNLPMLLKLEEIYNRIDEARKQLRFMQESPKAVASIYSNMFNQLHRLINGAEDKAFQTFSWENSYRTERDIDRLERRLFVFEQVIFWLSKEYWGSKNA